MSAFIWAFRCVSVELKQMSSVFCLVSATSWICGCQRVSQSLTLFVCKTFTLSVNNEFISFSLRAFAENRCVLMVTANVHKDQNNKLKEEEKLHKLCEFSPWTSAIVVWFTVDIKNEWSFMSTYKNEFTVIFIVTWSCVSLCEFTNHTLRTSTSSAGTINSSFLTHGEKREWESE